MEVSDVLPTGSETSAWPTATSFVPSGVIVAPVIRYGPVFQREIAEPIRSYFTLDQIRRTARMLYSANPEEHAIVHSSRHE